MYQACTMVTGKDNPMSDTNNYSIPNYKVCLFFRYITFSMYLDIMGIWLQEKRSPDASSPTNGLCVDAHLLEMSSPSENEEDLALHKEICKITWVTTHIYKDKEWRTKTAGSLHCQTKPEARRGGSTCPRPRRLVINNLHSGNSLEHVSVVSRRCNDQLALE